MPKTSTRYNSDEFVLKNQKNTTHLKTHTITSILNFSKSFKVESISDNSNVEYNLN